MLNDAVGVFFGADVSGADDPLRTMPGTVHFFAVSPSRRISGRIRSGALIATDELFLIFQLNVRTFSELVDTPTVTLFDGTRTAIHSPGIINDTSFDFRYTMHSSR